MVRGFLAFLIAAASLSAEHIYIGTSGKGIYLADFDAKTGKLGAPAIVSDAVAPSYITIHPDGRYLYAVNEVKDGAVSAFAIDSGSGKLTPINSASVKSAGPCYIAIDKSGHWAATANYSGGSITVLPIEGGGRVGEAVEFIQNKGSGPNRDRQTAPHPHWVGFIPKSNLALVTDLGIDEIAIYNFNAKTGALTVGPTAFMTIPPGSGPRHAVMHPTGKFLYVITELTSFITEYYFEAEPKRFTAVSTVSTLPEGFKGENTGAEIAMHPTGKFVYASNRGDDSIAVFSVTDFKRGTLKLEQHIPSGGKTPRQFEIDPSGHWLLAGNQGSDTIAIFSIDLSNGKLTAAGTVPGVVKPTCIKFAK
jgi:6-phosphogluconolactonase